MKKLLLFVLPFVLTACTRSDGERNWVADTDVLLDEVLNKSFKGIVNVPKDSRTYKHLFQLSEEAMTQATGSSKVGLPLLYQERNFPYVYNYYTDNQNDKEGVYKTMIGWICAMQLSELCPTKRNQLYKAGYEAGGYGMNTNFYGYHFLGDPNVARLVASAVYAAMHPTNKLVVDTMRNEVGGSVYDVNLAELYKRESRSHVTDDAFFVDLRLFMASAPGPIAPPFADRNGINPPIPDAKASNGCPQVDMDIYNHIVENYNLPDQRAVQATADEDSDIKHIFGPDKTNVDGKYNFHAAFGQSTIGKVISPDGKIANLVLLVLKSGNSGRGVLQHDSPALGHYEYGRLRPGCTETQQGKRKSYTDDRLNVLTCFAIEDNDGHWACYDVGDEEVPYLSDEGKWTDPEIQSEKDYEEMVKDKLYANSYPSGHSAAIWSAAMTLIEIYPQKADVIMRAANDFALSRVISRFHWNSDAIQGRIVGSVMNPVCHAAPDYFELLDAAKTEK